MLRQLLLWLMLFAHIVASTLLNINIYERQERVDLMLSFDTPFEGRVKKENNDDGSIHLTLHNVATPKPFYRSLRQSFVDAIIVTKLDSQTALVKIIPSHRRVGVKASKTVDGFGLRLRIYPLAATTHSNKLQPSTPPLTLNKPSAQPAQSEASILQISWRYWASLGLLIVVLIILLIVKKRSQTVGQGGSNGGWLMPKALQSALPGGEMAIVRFQKTIDAHNRIVLLEFNGRQYLMVVGSTNLLLDTFTQGRIEKEEDFSRMFEANKRQLDHFLQENYPDAYEAFKQNASKEEYFS